jgi:hypothetical protein
VRRHRVYQGVRCCDLWGQTESSCTNCPSAISVRTGKRAEGIVTDSDGRSWIVKSTPMRNTESGLIGFIEVRRKVEKRGGEDVPTAGAVM